MGEINKDFDGVSWEWRGKTFIDLKPICPDCKYELNIEITMPEMTIDRPKIIIHQARVSYVCSKCSFSIDTIENVESPKDLLKVVRKEFEHRQRLKASENTK
ncbi:MAG: hypothetical protein FVQ85_19865 [Planctomycetes bacterium]|nr:hypothetical protein [Planctomycetota bacterium]